MGNFGVLGVTQSSVLGAALAEFSQRNPSVWWLLLAPSTELAAENFLRMPLHLTEAA